MTVKKIRLQSLLPLLLLFTLSAPAIGQEFQRELKKMTPTMNGKDVARVQSALLKLNFHEIGEADGWYGQKTAGCVERMQCLLGMKPTGVVDRKLWNILFPKNVSREYSEFFKLLADFNKLDLTSLKKETIDVFGHSAEGGEATIYRKGEKGIVTVRLNLYGERGKSENAYYFFGQGDYLVTIKTWRYPEQFDVERAEISNETHFSTNQRYKIEDGVISEDKNYSPAGIFEMINSYYLNAENS